MKKWRSTWRGPGPLMTALSVVLAAACADPVWAGTSDGKAIDEIEQMRTARPTERSQALVIGDQLRVTFFEDVRPAEGVNKGVLSSLVERPEITGQYVIQQDGTLYLPLVGTVPAVGRGPAELEGDLEGRFTALFGSPAKIIIQFVEREPIYVTGPRIRATTVKYVPGMVVLHGLALAGALDSNSSDLWRKLDAAREMERLNQSHDRLVKLIAKRDVLLSERDGTFAQNRERHAALVGIAGANPAIAEERRLRELEKSKRTEAERSVDRQLETTQNELIGLHERLASAEAALKEKADYVKKLDGLRARGNVTDIAIHMAQGEWSNAREIWHSVRTLIAETERKQLELQERRKQIEVDAQLSRERELKATQDAISGEEVTQSSLGNGLVRLANSPVEGNSGNAPSWQIVRRTVSGLTRLDCEELTPLQPGDILELRGAPRAAMGRQTMLEGSIPGEGNASARSGLH